LHLVGVIGKDQLLDSAEELALNTEWLGERIQIHKSDTGTSLAATPLKGLDPTIISVRSQHMELEATGWRGKDGRLLLRVPATAQLDFTPALAE
jgi:hypothetical protein